MLRDPLGLFGLADVIRAIAPGAGTAQSATGASDEQLVVAFAGATVGVMEGSGASDALGAGLPCAVLEEMARSVDGNVAANAIAYGQVAGAAMAVAEAGYGVYRGGMALARLWKCRAKPPARVTPRAPHDPAPAPRPMAEPSDPFPPPPPPPPTTPSSPPGWAPPTNPPQPPTFGPLPDGTRIRVNPPTTSYPNGYWKYEKLLDNGGWQPLNPTTGCPGAPRGTHVPLPPGWVGPNSPPPGWVGPWGTPPFLGSD